MTPEQIRILEAELEAEADAELSLEQQLEAEADKKAAFRAKLEAEAAADIEAANPTKDMSTLQKTMSGIGRGMTDIVQNVGNIAGLVDDETITDRRALDQPLMNTGAGMAGSLIGETVALAPLGVAGKGGQILHKAMKGKKLLGPATQAGKHLSRTLSKLAPQGTRGTLNKARNLLPKALQGKAAPISLAVGEGAAAGSIIGGPDERGTGALIGGAAGGTLGTLGRVVSRAVKDGLVKRTRASQELAKVMRQKLGREPFAPVGMVGDPKAGSVSATGTSIGKGLVGQFPAAKGAFTKQGDDYVNDLYETMLRQAFKGKQADEAVKAFRVKGDVLAGLNAAKAAGSKMSSSHQRTLLDAASPAGRGRFLKGEADKAFSIDSIRRASQKAGREMGLDPQTVPFRSMIDNMADVIAKQPTESNLFIRALFNTIGTAADITSLGTAGKFLASKPIQKAIMGNTGWQRALQKAVKSEDSAAIMAVVSDVRRALSGSSAEPNIQMREEINALRGGM